MRDCPYDVVLFDLGGVLVRLRGPAFLLELTGMASEEDFWRRWLSCEWVRSFERGGCSAAEFSAGLVAEWGLGVSAEEFLEAFHNFPEGLYEGAAELVAEVRQRAKVGCLSNSNPPNWELMEQGWGLGAMFDFVFVSHLMGRVKPDREVFDHVVATLGLPAQRIIFLDDNLENVEGARNAGLVARQVKAPQEARSALVSLGVL